MKILSRDGDKIVLEIDVAELLRLGDMFSYASAQYSHIDEAILNLTKDEVALMDNEIHRLLKEIRHLRRG